MKSDCECKITDLLKDYTILHERIKVLYYILELNRRTSWNWDPTCTKKKVRHRGFIYGISLSVKKFGLINCKEDTAIESVRKNYIRDVKNEIKRYHRLQSNIQNVLNIAKESTRVINIRRLYNTEEVPSQFKNNMNYTYSIYHII